MLYFDLILTAILFVVVSALVLKIHKVPFYFPVPLFLFVNICLTVFGGILFGGFGDSIDDFYDLSLSTGQVLNSVISLFQLFGFFCVGVLLYQAFRKEPLNVNGSILGGNYSSMARKYSGVMLAFSCMPIVLMIIGGGFLELFSRTEYIVLKVPVFVNLGRNFSFLGVILVGIISVSSQRFKWVARCIFLIYVLIFFSYASRIFALLPIVYYVGVSFFNFMDGKSVKKANTKLILAVAFTPIMMQFPLFFRGFLEQGLLPFFQFIYNNGLGAVIGDEGLLMQYMENVLFYVPLTAYVAEYGGLSFQSVLVSLNPLPGSMVGWYEVYEDYRVNKYIPYNVAGELLNVSFSLAAAYYVLIGVYFAYLGNYLSASLRAGQIAQVGVVITMAAAITLIATQYNLRSVTRMFYYLMAIQVLIWMWRTFPFRTRHK
ncbi:MAG: hypothetical protein RPR97_09090 [Colwellia sp.]